MTLFSRFFFSPLYFIFYTQLASGGSYGNGMLPIKLSLSGFNVMYHTITPFSKT